MTPGRNPSRSSSGPSRLFRQPVGRERLPESLLRTLSAQRRALRAAEQAAALGESAFRSMVEHSALAVQITDEIGRIVEWNAASERLWGLLRHEVLGEFIWDVMVAVAPAERRTEALRAQLRSDIQAVLRTGAVVLADPADIEIHAADNRKIVMQQVAFPIKSAGGFRFCALSLDVTARRAAELRQRESEEEVRRLFDLSPVGIGLVALDNRFLRCNQALCRFWGYSEAELCTLTIADVTLPSDRRVGVEQMHAIVAGELEEARVEKRYVRKDGSVAWGEVTIRLVQDRDGSPRYFLPVIRDISKRKASEERVLESLSLLEATIESTADALMVADGMGHMTRFNRKFAELWGLSDDVLVMGDEEAALRHVAGQLKDPEAFLAKVRALYLDPGAASFDLLEVVDGRFLERYSQPQVIAGKVVGRVWSFRDVTERRRADDERMRLEGQLAQAQKLESVGRLAGGVAHDFNNLLTSIIGNASLALLDVSADHPLCEPLLEITKAAESAAGLTRQLLAFSRKQIVAPKAVDVNEALGNLRKMVQRLIGEDIKLRVNLGEDAGSIRIDPSQLEQIVMNLCVNARDAMPDGGKLAIDTSAVDLDARFCASHAGAEPGRYVRLTVRDSGSGIAPGMLDKIFEPFFTTKELGKGTGLGLAMVYGVVSQNHGAITVDSRLGEGTTFCVYLPCLRASDDPVAEAADAAVLPRGTETIILVEDEVSVRNLAVRVLSRLGYDVKPFADGRSALQADPADFLAARLLLTDVILPEMNGRVLAETLCQRYPRLKVLFTSGYTGDVIVHHGMLDEGIEFIGKPFTPKALAEKVRAVLDASP